KGPTLASTRRPADRYSGPPPPARGDYGGPARQPHQPLAPLVEFIARELADNPDEVQVREHPATHFVTLELHVNERDMGRVIGRQGRVAPAIPTPLPASPPP